QQRRQDRRVRLPSGGKQQCGLRALGMRDPGLDLGAGRARPADQPRRSRPSPVVPDVAACPGNQVRVQGQPKVIVAAEVQDLAPTLHAPPGECMAENTYRTPQVLLLRRAKIALEERIESVPRHVALPPE